MFYVQLVTYNFCSRMTGMIIKNLALVLCMILILTTTEN